MFIDVQEAEPSLLSCWLDAELANVGGCLHRELGPNENVFFIFHKLRGNHLWSIPLEAPKNNHIFLRNPFSSALLLVLT